MKIKDNKDEEDMEKEDKEGKEEEGMKIEGDNDETVRADEGRKERKEKGKIMMMGEI